MDVLVGCPVAARDWCIEHWWRFAEISALQAGMTPRFLLVAGHQDTTAETLAAAGCRDLIVHRIDDDRDHDSHDWANPGRIERMVELRNILVERVTQEAPDLFLSLDSDILLHPDALRVMRRLLDDGFDAAGSACFLSGARSKPPENWNPPPTAPNFALLTPENKMRRDFTPDAEHRVDVLMAIKLMTPPVYRQVRYEMHHLWEDTGWSVAATRQGFKLGWSAKALSKHLMSRWMLDIIDPRVGF